MLDEQRGDDPGRISLPIACAIAAVVRGSEGAAAYFPGTNSLVYKENVAWESNIPEFRAMFVRFERHVPARSEARYTSGRAVDFDGATRQMHTSRWQFG